MSFFRIRFALIATLLSCSFVLPVAAQTAADTNSIPTSKLSLRDAITATLARNPQLSSFQFRRQALEGELQTAGLKPAMRLGTTLENAAGSGDYKGTKGAELTLALSSVIELGDKRDARMGVVTERQQALAVEQRIVELDLLAEVTRRFIEVATAQQHLTLQQSTLALATETTQSIKRRVDAGNTPDAELARAQANQSRMAIELRQAELGFDTAKIKLSALWAVTEPSFTSVNADLLNLGDSPSLNDLLNGLANNPDVQLFASETRLRDAELRLALSQRKADLEWNAGIRRLQASKDSALVVGVSVPLFGGSRAAGEVATAKANRLGVDNERETALLQLRAQVVGLYQERQAAIFEVTSLRNDVIPQLKKAVSGTRAAFDKGRYGYLELSTAQHELLEAEAALIDAAANAHLLRAEIERLSGTATTAQHSEVAP
ncbi:cobalt transporter [Cellvibrio zantedeschiae]|uniref:Cobalt transporter n=1 Tax=Cellvibrio zantedeschiae TaxID=1237077 RepID=A0ABQ3B7Q4_9GAMM|nr:TolC family protein [Cellvibrio zantedeschiae]GGY79312.1 cobalt transporter [Cellvibrio zantedeschiae]